MESAGSREDVQESVTANADRYLTRIYSPRELTDCLSTPPAVAAERLAARFAAKEAAMKVLRPASEDADPAIPWNTIEVVRDVSGAPELAVALGARGGTGAPRGRDDRRGEPHPRAELRSRSRRRRGRLMNEAEITARVRNVVRSHARLPVDVDDLADDADPLSSRDDVARERQRDARSRRNLRPGLPRTARSTRRMFESVASIRSAVATLTGAVAG